MLLAPQCWYFDVLLKKIILLCVSGVTLACTLHMTPEAMATCWEAFSLTKKVSELTSHTFEAYEIQVRKQSEVTPPSMTSDGAIQTRSVKRQASMVTPPTAKRQHTSNGKVSSASASSVDSVALETNNSPTAAPRPEAPPLPKYDERTKAGQIVASYNPKEWPVITPSAASGSDRCVLKTDGLNNISEPYRHMFTATADRAQALEAHLLRMGQNIVEKYGISDGQNGIAPLEQVNIPRQEAVCCVGRICNEVSCHLSHLASRILYAETDALISQNSVLGPRGEIEFDFGRLGRI